VKNKEKARIHIGDRVPVITTTAAATGGFVSESVTYLDVGLKLEVEPLISLEDEVNMKVSLEVSNITQTVKSTSGTLTYQLGTRTAATNLRLRDGETQVLAGLISDDDRRTADRVPGLGDLPIAGRLFSHTSDTRNRTEIVLLITPRLQRTLARPEAGSVEFPAGTEASSSGLRLGGVPTVIPPITPPVQPTQPVQPIQPIQPIQPTQPAPGAPSGTPQPMTPSAPSGSMMPQQPSAPMMVPFGGTQPPGQQ
jgi:general secretion pathway protein D